MTNEFEDIKDEVPATEFSDVPKDIGTPAENQIASGASGSVYDWSNAPEGVKAPPRADLNGREVTIKKADIVLPPSNREWVRSKAGTSEYKYCTFALHYDVEGQQEFYSGVRVFKREENGEAKYSHPTLTRDRNNQASKLLGIYADFKGKDINEVSMREFMGFLNSAPKCLIKTESVLNPSNNETVHKNVVDKFI